MFHILMQKKREKKREKERENLGIFIDDIV